MFPTNFLPEWFHILMGYPQKLDDKLVKRLESAITKSDYSQGKKLKVITKVVSSTLHNQSTASVVPVLTEFFSIDQPRYPRWPHC